MEVRTGEMEESEINQDIKTCTTCHVFEHKCACLIECSICNKSQSETVSCECDWQHAKILSAKIDKSLSGGLEEPGDQENCITAADQEGVSEIIDKIGSRNDASQIFKDCNQNYSY